ncbi:MAG: PDZ domain-containing protein, partial [Deltaproteobacteria bacterium]|nr:PDZ domain-containing protein [Deltaproteobacteria bacterium]
GYAVFSGDGHFAADSGQGGFLGVQLTELTADLRAHFGAPADQGVMVGSVVAESAAQQAGLQVGDIVTTVNGDAVGSAAALSHAIGGLEPGTSVELGVLRDGVSSLLTAALGERKMKAAPRMHKIVVMCEEGNEDCEVDAHTAMFDCGEAEECEVEVMCEGDECTCTVNGEPMDCGEMDIPGHP